MEISTIRTGNKAIAKDVKICSNLFSQARGLMFRMKKNLLMVFPAEQRISLHMLFVFFPIWCLYLDAGKTIVFQKKLLPFISFAFPDARAKYVIEVTQDPKVAVGEKVRW